MSVIIIITPPPTKPGDPNARMSRNSDMRSHIDASAAHAALTSALETGCRVRVIDTESDA